MWKKNRMVVLELKNIFEINYNIWNWVEGFKSRLNIEDGVSELGKRLI